MEMSHTAEAASGKWYCGAVVAGADRYCARTSTLQAFCEANRCCLHIAAASPCMALGSQCVHAPNILICVHTLQLGMLV